MATFSPHLRDLRISRSSGSFSTKPMRHCGDVSLSDLAYEVTRHMTRAQIPGLAAESHMIGCQIHAEASLRDLLVMWNEIILSHA